MATRVEIPARTQIDRHLTFGAELPISKFLQQSHCPSDMRSRKTGTVDDDRFTS